MGWEKMVRSSRVGVHKKKHRLQHLSHLYCSRDWHSRAVLGMFGMQSQMGDLDAKLERAVVHVHLHRVA